MKNQETWSAFADFSERDVHRQYAIAFKYRKIHNSFELYFWVEIIKANV